MDSADLPCSWQQCGAGIDNSFHDAQGNPIVNKGRFPSMKSMTDYGHSKGLEVGWCKAVALRWGACMWLSVGCQSLDANNCICEERGFPTELVQAHYENDVKATLAYGTLRLKYNDQGSG